MSTLWLKAKTRSLIAACGGLTEASRACAEGARNYSVQHLSRCQTAGLPDMLPIDIVACLEAYCGDPIVSRAMVEARPATLVPGQLRDEGDDVIEAAGALFGRIRAALSDDGQINAREAGEIAGLLETAQAELRDVAGALDGLIRGRT